MSLFIKKAGASQGATDTEVWFVPIAGVAGTTADFVAVGAASAQFGTITLAAGKLYVLTSSTDCWFLQGANPTAAKASPCMFVQKGVQLMVDGAQGAKVALIQDAVGGNASINQIDA